MRGLREDFEDDQEWMIFLGVNVMSPLNTIKLSARIVDGEPLFLNRADSLEDFHLKDFIVELDSAQLKDDVESFCDDES